jgi:type VI protein secretion system component VasF
MDGVGHSPWDPWMHARFRIGQTERPGCSSNRGAAPIEDHATAIDRAVQVLEETQQEPQDTEVLQRLRKVRQEIADEVLREGFNSERNTFTQYYGR